MLLNNVLRFISPKGLAVLGMACCALGLTLQAEAQSLRYAPAGGVITSEFGYRQDPFSGNKKFHAGLDIAAPTGTPIYAPESGTIAFAGTYGGYGNMVLVKHDRDGLYTIYGHCSKLLVQEKQRITYGQPIALVGSTGRSTGPHLHFEVHYKNRYLNPVDYLVFLQNEQIANGLIKENQKHTYTAIAPTPLPPAIGGPE